jgi:hypothetical protein
MHHLNAPLGYIVSFEMQQKAPFVAQQRMSTAMHSDAHPRNLTIIPNV